MHSEKCKVMITVPNPPTVSISGDTVVCAGDSVHLVASGAPNYVWKYGGTTPNFDDILPITQYISVVGTDANNCIGKDSVIVLVNPLPKPNLGPDTSIFVDSIILNPGSFASYQWNTGDITSSIVVNSNLSPGNYTYAVEVENQYGCNASDTIIISITTDINTAENEVHIKVYPNPSKGLINLEWSMGIELQAIDVYDTYGKLIQSSSIENSLLKTQINLQSVAKGTYLLYLRGDKFVKVVKVVVE